jgi:hypothetical protein
VSAEFDAPKEVTAVDKAQEVFYAVVGAGDFALEKARKFSDRKTTQKFYKDFVKRGRTVSTRVRGSATTKQAVAQTKAARSQVKAAATSVTKAIRTDAKAAKEAPKTVTKPSAKAS